MVRIRIWDSMTQQIFIVESSPSDSRIGSTRRLFVAPIDSIRPSFFVTESMLGVVGPVAWKL